MIFNGNGSALQRSEWASRRGRVAAVILIAISAITMLCIWSGCSAAGSKGVCSVPGWAGRVANTRAELARRELDGPPSESWQAAELRKQLDRHGHTPRVGEILSSAGLRGSREDEWVTLWGFFIQEYPRLVMLEVDGKDGEALYKHSMTAGDMIDAYGVQAGASAAGSLAVFKWNIVLRRDDADIVRIIDQAATIRMSMSRADGSETTYSITVPIRREDTP